MTPREFRDAVLGKRFDVDNFPPSNPYQCFDLFSYCLIVLGIPVDTYCAITGYVSDLWKLRDQYGYYQYFDYIYDAKQLINGDWCFWDRGNSSHPSGHVCMYYDGKALGQNQPYPYVTEKNTTWDIMGALRPKFWEQPKKGYAEKYDFNMAGTYVCAYPLHLRTGGHGDPDIQAAFAHHHRRDSLRDGNQPVPECTPRDGRGRGGKPSTFGRTLGVGRLPGDNDGLQPGAPRGDGAPEVETKKEPAASYSRTGESRTTLGDEALDFSVRNGNWYDNLSMATGVKALRLRKLKRTATQIETASGLSLSEV